MSRLLVFIILVLTCLSAESQEQMTLNKAMALAIENNFGLQIAEKNILIAESNNNWAAAGRAPRVDLNVGWNNSVTDDNNPASFLQGAFYNGSLNAGLAGNWVLYSGGRVGIAKEQLDLLVQREQLNKETDLQNLIRQVYQQYYAVVLQQAQLEVLRESQQVSSDKLDYENVKKEFGQSNSANILQFENSLVSDSLNVISQKLQVETAKNVLYNTLNISLDSSYTFDEELEILSEEIDKSKLHDLVAESNFTLKSLYLLQDLSQLNTKLAKTQRRPQISLNGNLNFAENGFRILEDNPSIPVPDELLLSNRINGQLNLQGSWNLYDGGQNRRAAENAKLEETIAKLNYDQAFNNIVGQIDLLVENYEAQRQLLQLSDEQIRLANQNLALMEERYKAGQSTSLDFRSVQLQYLNAAFAKVNAIYNLIITKSEIDYLVGKFEQK